MIQANSLMLRAVRCPECSSLCLTLKQRSRLEETLLLLTGRQHYQCGSCGNGFDSLDRRVAVRRTALLFLMSITLSCAVTFYYHARMLRDFGRSARTEWQADIVSIKDDGRLATLETGSMRGEVRQLWRDVKYEAGRLSTSWGLAAAPVTGDPEAPTK